MTDPSASPPLRSLLAQRVALGFGVTMLRGAHAVAAARQAGCEWLFIDMEHGAYSIAEAAEICLGGACAGITPFVRSRLADLSAAARLLDNGCGGIVVPRVRTEAEAREIVRALRLPPVGARGIGGAGLAHARGALSSAAGRAAVDRNILIAATIEDPAGVENARAIASIAGIDILLLGASDLSFELGTDGNANDPRIRSAAMAAAAACREEGRVFGVGGIYAPGPLADYMAMGARFVLAGMDHAFLVAASSERVAGLRRIANGPPAATAPAPSPGQGSSGKREEP